MTETLQSEIDARSREIHTDRYSMSLSEMMAMYKAKELEVHPEFQRIFRWSLEQQSRLIESVFLGIPIPPIFAVQRKDGLGCRRWRPATVDAAAFYGSSPPKRMVLRTSQSLWLLATT